MRGIQGKDKGNTTLPINYEEIESFVILDSESSITTAPKIAWEKWEKPFVRWTCISS